MIKCFEVGKTYLKIEQDNDTTGLKIQVLEVHSEPYYREPLYFQLIKIVVLVSPSTLSSLFFPVGSTQQWEEQLSWWIEIATEQECPNCKNKVKPDLLGLCPNCTWLMKEGG